MRMILASGSLWGVDVQFQCLPHSLCAIVDSLDFDPSAAAQSDVY